MTLKSTSFMYLEDKDYHEISETLGISEVNASEDE
jgi:RNA polymerase sigma-70 factor (ECF subfamily)